MNKILALLLIIGQIAQAAPSSTTAVQAGKIRPTAALTPEHTVPNVTSDTFTLNAATQTLTNKTLTSPTINGGTFTGVTITSLARSSLAAGTAYRLLANDSLGAMGENAALTATGIPYADANGQLATDVGTNVGAYWDSTNHRLGINVAAPQGVIHVVSPNTQIFVDRYVVSSATSPASVTFRQARGTVAVPTKTLSGDFMAGFRGRGYFDNGSGTFGFNAADAGAIHIVATQDYTTASTRGSKIILQTTPNNTSTAATALTLDQDQSATFANTVNATTFVGALTGNVTGNASGTAATFTGSLTGDVTSTGMATTIASLARSKLASGTNYRLLANSSSGVMSENAALTATGIPYADTNGQLATDTTANLGLIWDATNHRLGLGTTAPVSALHISAANANTGGIYIDNAASNPFVALRQSGGTQSSPTKTTSGSVVASFSGRGYQETTSAFSSGPRGRITMTATEDYTSTSQGTSMTFATTPSGTTTLTTALTLGQDQSATFAAGVTGTTANFATSITSPSVTDSGLTAAGVVYAGTGGLLSTNTTDGITWDNTNKKLKIGDQTGVSTGFVPYLHLVTTSTSQGVLNDRYGGIANYTGRRANGTVAAPTKVVSGDVLGGLFIRGYFDNGAGSSGFNTLNAALIQAQATEDFSSSTNKGTKWVIQTTPTGTATLTTALTIDQDQSATFAGAVVASTTLAVTGASTLTGNVGVGMTPVNPFDLTTTNGTFNLSTNASVQATRYGNAQQNIYRRANGTSGSPTATASSDVLATFAGRGYYVTGGPAFSSINSGSIKFVATEAYTSTANGGSIVFSTVPNLGTTETVALTLGQDQSATFVGKITPSAGIVGTATNDSATAGNVGEYTIQSRVRSAATSITTATDTNVTASPLSLTAGDWMACGAIGYIPAATTTVTNVRSAIATTSATLPGTDVIAVPTSNQNRVTRAYFSSVPNGDIVETIPCYRVSVASTTSLYLVASPNFGTSTMTVYGSLWAWRIR